MTARRGDLPKPSREIDLHGLDVARALRKLEAELVFCRARRISPLLVITGRGWGSSGGKGVLFPAVRKAIEQRAAEFGVVECRPAAKGGALWVRIDPDRAGSSGEG